MLCLCWRVINWPLLLLPLHALLLISECVCGENYLGLLSNDNNLLQTNEEFKLSRVDNKVIRFKRQKPSYPSPGSPVGPPIHPDVRPENINRVPDILPTVSVLYLHDEDILSPPVARVSRQGRGNPECQNGGELWIPPGQRKQDQLPPGLRRKGPCRNHVPPGQKKKITQALNDGDFIFPVEDGDSPQNNRENVVVYIENRSVILLRLQEIRK